MAKILLYMYLDINFGDDCMIRLFLSRFPEHEFHLYTRRLDYAVLLEDIPNLTVINRDMNIDSLKAENIKYDYFTMVGGSFFTTKPIGRVKEELKRALMFRYLHKNGTTCAVIGSNITETVTDWYQKPLIKCIVRDMALFSVRDQFSFDVFSPFMKGAITCFPDMVFAWDVEKFSPAERLPGCLGVSAYRASSTLANTAFTVSTVRALAQLCDEYCDKSPEHTVKLFAFDTAHENDTYAALQILRRMRHRDRAELVLYDGDVDRVIAEMNRCSVFLPIRFHAVVFSMLLGIPFVPVSYANKTENMLHDMGYTGTILPWKELTEGATMTALLQALEQEQRRPTRFDVAGLRQRAEGHYAQFRKLTEQK